MNKITLRLTVNEGHEESFDNFTANKSINNVSSLIGTPTTRSGGRYGKSLAKGYLTFYNGNLGNKDTKLMSEVNKYNGYMFGTTDSDGKYSLTLTLNGSNFDKIIIYGDNDAEQWATTAIVDGKTIYSDDNIWAIIFEEEKNTHTIEFTEWNKPHYNACITHIDVMLKYLDLDNFWIDNIDSTSQSVPAPNEITYGVLANSGVANIRDLDGEFYDYIKDGILPNSNIPVSLFVNGKQVQAHITNDSDYNETDTMLSLQFTNRLSDWDSLIYSGRNLSDSMSAYSLLLEVLQTLGFAQVDVDEMLDSNILYGNDNQVGSVKDYLEEITIEYPYLESASYRETINKVCTFAQLNVFESDSGKIKFVSARPVVLQDQVDSAIRITDTYLAEDLQNNIVLKNKYDGTQIVENIISYNYNQIASTKQLVYTQFPSPDVPFVDGDLTMSGWLKTSHFTLINGIADGFTVVRDNVNWDFTGSTYNLTVIKYKLSSTERDRISKFNDFMAVASINDVATPLSHFNYLIKSQATESDTSGVYYSEADILNMWIGIDGKVISLPSNGVFEIKILKDSLGDYYVYFLILKNAYINSNKSFAILLESISFNILMKSIESENVDTTSSDKNFISIDGNELQSGDTKYKSISIISLMDTNITIDYANGVSNGTATIFMGDYYNSAGERVLEWEKGEIAQVGQVVYFENDLKPDLTQRYWKITGRTFRWDSSPLVDLQLQEVRVFA